MFHLALFMPSVLRVAACPDFTGSGCFGSLLSGCLPPARAGAGFEKSQRPASQSARRTCRGATSTDRSIGTSSRSVFTGGVGRLPGAASLGRRGLGEIVVWGSHDGLPTISIGWRWRWSDQCRGDAAWKLRSERGGASCLGSWWENARPCSITRKVPYNMAVPATRYHQQSDFRSNADVARRMLSTGRR